MNIGSKVFGQIKTQNISLDQMGSGMFDMDVARAAIVTAQLDRETWRWECAVLGLHERKDFREDGIDRWHYECKFA